MERMKLGFDSRWLLPLSHHLNLPSVGCSRTGVVGQGFDASRGNHRASIHHAVITSERP
jgi:hypothetical protein